MIRFITIVLICVFTLSGYAQKIHPIVSAQGDSTIMPSYTTVDSVKWSPQSPDVNKIHAAAIHIAAQQCPNGGFGWPHNDCTTTYNNITAPILNGIHQAWKQTDNGAYLGVMVDGGNYDLLYQFDTGEPRISTKTPLFMWEVSKASGDSVYYDHIENNIFAAMETSSYGPDALDTAAWIASVVTARQGAWINLLPWEFSSMPLIAQRHCRTNQAALFEQAILDGFNSMNNTDPANVYSDLIGIAGGVWGLAAINRQTFPAINAALHSGINGMTTLQELADFLISQQNSDGSWYWHSNLTSPTDDDKDTQTTAYAILALIKAKERLGLDYLPAINSGQNWLESMQNQYGGFPSNPGGTENTEVEAEALTALATVGIYDRIYTSEFECYQY